FFIVFCTNLATRFFNIKKSQKNPPNLPICFFNIKKIKKNKKQQILQYIFLLHNNYLFCGALVIL
ncbi:hypothetical protein, partial [Klebsiella pneumoniae]|uniref:hypothetical protein n=1 Tax=Klebsiella pneumoniae TaxID=573 RepID=UPI001BE115BD